MNKIILLVWVSGLVCFISCSKNGSGGNTPPPVNTCNGVAANFAADVQPIIAGNCAIAGCHGPGSFNGPGELTSYDKIKAASGSIKTAVVSRVMPKTGSLTDAQIKSISCWVDGGALNN